MPKYVHFTKYPGFMPMYNPYEMKVAGVFNSTNKNYYGVEAHHGDFDALLWYNWFYHLYKDPLGDRNQEEAKRMIALWARALWKVWDEILKTEDPITKECQITDTQKQTLLELAWDWRNKPNFDKQWMFDQFPLAQ